ncbi:hypothetical protein D3C85_1390690 [compost metagenome]
MTNSSQFQVKVLSTRPLIVNDQFELSNEGMSVTVYTRKFPSAPPPTGGEESASGTGSGSRALALLAAYSAVPGN